jgi:hypothetical protein
VGSECRWLDVGSALRFAGTSRTGRTLVLLHHRAARFVVQFLVRRLLSVAGLPSSPNFTSLTQGKPPAALWLASDGTTQCLTPKLFTSAPRQPLREVSALRDSS